MEMHSSLSTLQFKRKAKGCGPNGCYIERGTRQLADAIAGAVHAQDRVHVRDSGEYLRFVKVIAGDVQAMRCAFV